MGFLSREETQQMCAGAGEWSEPLGGCVQEWRRRLSHLLITKSPFFLQTVVVTLAMLEKLSLKILT